MRGRQRLFGVLWRDVDAFFGFPSVFLRFFVFAADFR
jgi:hypothetical protein